MMICNDFSNATNMRATAWTCLGTSVPLRAGPRRHLAWELRGQGLVLYDKVQKEERAEQNDAQRKKMGTS